MPDIRCRAEIVPHASARAGRRALVRRVFHDASSARRPAVTTPDGTRIVSGSLDKTMRLWGCGHLKTGRRPLTGHAGAVDGVAFSPDGTRIVSGKRDPRTLAGLARASARKKTDRLEEALRGFFTDHHATILQMMLDNSDRISAQIAALDARIEEAIGLFPDRRPGSLISPA